VLGRDALSGESLSGFAIPGTDAQGWRELTAEPRRYGFHATLKAPFRLAAGLSADELFQAVAALADTLQPSGGGSAIRTRRRCKSSGVRTFADAPLPRRRSPIAEGPSALQRSHELFDPTLAERGHPRHLAGRMTLRQQPDRLETPRRHRVLARLAPLLQRRNAQMTGNVSHARLPRFMAVLSTDRKPRRESNPRRVNQPETV
jgi:hypothetical protein